MTFQEGVLSYNPVQPGYRLAGKHFIQLDYSRDCTLGNYISSMFEVDCPSEKDIRVIPDGCNDIVVAFDGNGIRSWLSPSIPRAYTFHFDHLLWVFGVRFLPGVTHTLFSDNVEYCREKIEASLLLPDFTDVEQKLYVAQSFARRRELAEAYLFDRVNECEKNDSVLLTCVDRLIESKGLTSVQDLANEVGYSMRYLRQMFLESIGHAPKEFANIIRMQSALRYIEDEGSQVSLSTAAARFGFSDQSHMNREFHKFLGVPAGNIRKEDDWIVDLITGLDRTFC